MGIHWLIKKSSALAKQSETQIHSSVRLELKKSLYQSTEHLVMKDDLIKH